MDWYPWVVFAHVAGGFAFVLAHGASVFVAFQLKRERRPEHVATLLGLSSSSMGLMYLSFIVLALAGVGAAFMGDWWGRWWIWASIGILLAITIAMYAIGTRYYVTVRQAVGIPAPRAPQADASPSVATAEELDALLTSRVPEALALIGGVGLVALIWLMEVKPA